MKNLASVLLLVLIVGCADLSTSVFRSEQATVKTAQASIHGFNLYYQSATNGASPEQLTKLNSAKEEVYRASRDLRVTLGVVESARAAYDANSSDTNKATLQLAFEMIGSQSSNVTYLVRYFMGPTK